VPSVPSQNGDDRRLLGLTRLRARWEAEERRAGPGSARRRRLCCAHDRNGGQHVSPFTPHSLLEWFAMILNHFLRASPEWRVENAPDRGPAASGQFLRCATFCGLPAQPRRRCPWSFKAIKSTLKKSTTELLSARDARSSITNSVRPTRLTAASAKPLPSASYPRGCES
jgi:hypothetical protein